MPQTVTKVGPKDHGRRMSLAEFDKAQAQEGYRYELSRGVIVVSDIPDVRHLLQLYAVRRQFSAYDLSNPGRIYAVTSAGESKLLIAGMESERHPDLSVYRDTPPEEDYWSVWVPDIVLEVVSAVSEQCDRTEKPEEYLRFGVKEYWIVDGEKREVVVLRRAAGDWKERLLRPPDVYRTHLLPGFEFVCAPVFEAADSLSR